MAQVTGKGFLPSLWSHFCGGTLQPHPVPTSPSTSEIPETSGSPTSLERPFLTHQPGTVTLAFVRHGQQEMPGGAFTPGLWLDPPLSSRGRRQAAAVGAALASEPVDEVYCSHLRRADETAAAVAGPHGLDRAVYRELREIETYRDVPEGVTIDEVLSPVMWRGVQARFERECRWDVSPFSEGSAEFRARIVTVVEGIIASAAGTHIAIVCHGGVINAYLGHLLGLEVDMFFRPVHASITRVLVGPHGRRVIHTLNELHHLQSVDPDLVSY